MPYKHELANSLGAMDLLRDEHKEWMLKRLKTYSRKPYRDEDEGDYLGALKFIDARDLKLHTDFQKAVAVDGSLASLEDPSVTVIKIASVWADLTVEAKYLSGVIDPSSLKGRYKSEFGVGLLPGRDIYPKDKQGSWDAKFREELFASFRHMNVHNSNRSFPLAAFLRKFLDGEMDKIGLKCPNCGSERIDFSIEGFETFCDACNADIYITDYLSGSLFTAASSGTGPMLLAEQILFHSLIHGVSDGHIPGHSTGDTLFIADGPLRMFLLPQIARIGLEKLQAMRPYPAVVSFMKSGHVEKIFDNPKADELLEPGHVALITDEMRDHKKGDIGKQANSGLYGKSFAYRTRDGSKRFGFMMPPRLGSLGAEHAHSSVIDEWGNYPHLRGIVEFIEKNATNENGAGTPSLDIIGQANFAASLPYNLSKSVLTDLVADAKLF